MARDRNFELIDVVNWPEWDRLLDIYHSLDQRQSHDILQGIDWHCDPALGPREDRLLLALKRGNIYTGKPIPLPSGMIDGAVEYDEAMAAQDIMSQL